MADTSGSGRRPARFEFDPEMVEILRRSHGATPLHQLLGLKFVSSDADGVVVEMPVAPEALNGSGNLHGGAIATLIDVASGSAAAHGGTFRPGENSLVTADLHVRYLGRPKGALARAEARIVRAGRQLIVVECRVADELGNVIAVADFAAMIVPLRQPLETSDTGADARMPDL